MKSLQMLILAYAVHMCTLWFGPNALASVEPLDMLDLDRADNEYEFFRQAPPSVPHLVITPEEIGSKDVFVIGDVHGCYDELVEILETSGVRNNSNAIVIFAGDLVEKGPKSKEVINIIREIGAYSARGNHDHKSLMKRLQLEEWENRDPIEEKNKWFLDLEENDIAFLLDLPYTISIPSLNAVIVHAGLVPNRPLTHQEPRDMMEMRNLISKPMWDTNSEVVRYEAIHNYETGESWSEVWVGPGHVYYGHAASRGLNLQISATGLDSGCVYGGGLTGVFLTGEKEMIYVKSHAVYHEHSQYPRKR